MTKFNAEILNSAGTLVTAFATVLLALATILLARATSRLNKISEELKATQHSAALTQAFNVQNSLALSSDANLMVANSLIAPEDTSHTIEGARERWMSFVLLNVQALIFASRDQDATFREIWEAARHGVLDHLLRNKSVINLAAYAWLCAGIRRLLRGTAQGDWAGVVGGARASLPQILMPAGQRHEGNDLAAENIRPRNADRAVRAGGLDHLQNMLCARRADGNDHDFRPASIAAAAAAEYGRCRR